MINIQDLLIFIIRISTTIILWYLIFRGVISIIYNTKCNENNIYHPLISTPNNNHNTSTTTISTSTTKQNITPFKNNLQDIGEGYILVPKMLL